MKNVLLAFVLFGCLHAQASEKSLADQCFDGLKSLPGKHKEDVLKTACASVGKLPNCESTKGADIYHFDKISTHKDAKKILVFSLIHGDEGPSGSVARSWMERLTAIDARNSWRIVPVLNPDGLAKKTRTNANGVDINRNFPTKDWEADALKYWEKKTKKDVRRYPGPTGGSEAETKCAMEHIEDFSPNLIIGIHTPYGVLDFDGPKISFPAFGHIPWKSLGNYPGSLGRYMWVDQSKPTLTVELHEKEAGENLERFDKLQDITGDLAIRSEKIISEEQQKKQKKTSSNSD